MSEKCLADITPLILPNGCSFFPQQVNAIEVAGSANIVAGPGSGKTTVLIAKCALLLSKQKSTDRGICLITHTNVAVDEIKMGLKKIGINDVSYPNFIGTIQEFFNSFFTRKAFYLVHKDKHFRVIDDEEYKKKFGALFDKKKPDWYTYPTPNITRALPKLIINDDYSYTIISQANQSYRSEFNECLKMLFNWGLVNNEQCLELSKWYIEKNQEKIISSIKHRFEYLLLDEAQDTSELQYNLLKKLFSSPDIVFQKFGDPYQSLYSIFDGNRDAWKPSEEFESCGLSYEEISETSRFGSSISELVKNICIEKYDTFTSLNLVDSFNPHYIIYESENDLLEQYKSLINYCTLQSTEYSKSRKKDAIISAFHEDLSSIFTSYNKPTTKVRNIESIVRKCYNFFIDLLSKELDLSSDDLMKKVEEELIYKVILSKCVKEINSENFIGDFIIWDLERIIQKITGIEDACFKNIDAEAQIKYLYHTIVNTKTEKQLETTETENLNFSIGTIHSAKGETHRSTMLVLNTVFKDRTMKPTYRMIDLLKEYLVGKYSDPYSVKEDLKRDEMIKSLKLAYVALSRPTHLAVIAIPNEMIFGQEELITELNDSGWKSLESYKNEILEDLMTSG